jgi:hypothetical protein
MFKKNLVLKVQLLIIHKEILHGPMHQHNNVMLYQHKLIG